MPNSVYAEVFASSTTLVLIGMFTGKHRTYVLSHNSIVMSYNGHPVKTKPFHILLRSPVITEQLFADIACKVVLQNLQKAYID